MHGYGKDRGTGTRERSGQRGCVDGNAVTRKSRSRLPGVFSLEQNLVRSKNVTHSKLRRCLKNHARTESGSKHRDGHPEIDTSLVTGRIEQMYWDVLSDRDPRIALAAARKDTRRNVRTISSKRTETSASMRSDVHDTHSANFLNKSSENIRRYRHYIDGNKLVAFETHGETAVSAEHSEANSVGSLGYPPQPDTRKQLSSADPSGPTVVMTFESNANCKRNTETMISVAKTTLRQAITQLEQLKSEEEAAANVRTETQAADRATQQAHEETGNSRKKSGKKKLVSTARNPIGCEANTLDHLLQSLLASELAEKIESEIPILPKLRSQGTTDDENLIHSQAASGRLERLWYILQTTLEDRARMISTIQDASRFEAVIAEWERIAAAVLHRERLLQSLHRLRKEVEHGGQTDFDLVKMTKENCLGIILATKRLQELTDALWRRFQARLRIGGREYPGGDALQPLQLMELIRWVEQAMLDEKRFSGIGQNL